MIYIISFNNRYRGPRFLCQEPSEYKKFIGCSYEWEAIKYYSLKKARKMIRISKYSMYDNVCSDFRLIVIS